MSEAGLLDSPANGVWKFRLGHCVQSTGNNTEAEGIVIQRLRLTGGGRLYKLLKVFDDDGEVGYADEDSIQSVDLGGRCCVECPLLKSIICPLLKVQ